MAEERTLAAIFADGDATRPDHVPRLVDELLSRARAVGATDVHLQPQRDGLRVAWRIDGVLHDVARLESPVAGKVVSRLKVLAELLTYRTELPQEGRIRRADPHGEVRVATFPTVFGERVVLRLFARADRLRTLADLGLPEGVRDELQRALGESGKSILITGPAGSGKTTTAYAALRAILADPHVRRNVVTLEDPVEAIVDGAVQSQVNPAAGFEYESGLRSLLRQDPEVILVGEIRDAAVARIVVQAALTGHLVLSTFHAGSAAEAVGRLLEMGVEPYQLRSALATVVNQHLLRSLCDCAEWTDAEESRLELPVSRVRLPHGCEACRGTGYAGRFVVGEVLQPSASPMAPAILERQDSDAIERAAVAAGMRTRFADALDAVADGRTSPAELRRAFGFRSFTALLD